MFQTRKDCFNVECNQQIFADKILLQRDLYRILLLTLLDIGQKIRVFI